MKYVHEQTVIEGSCDSFLSRSDMMDVIMIGNLIGNLSGYTSTNSGLNFVRSVDMLRGYTGDGNTLRSSFERDK